MSENSIRQAAVISKRIAPVIAATAERIHYAEARRVNYSVMAGLLIAAGITIFTFAFGTTDMLWMRFGAIAGSFSMILVGAVILYVFGKQINRYPFTSATKTWKWFYRDALPDHKAFDLKLYQSWSAQETSVKEAYADQLPKFKKQMLRLADDQTDLEQDIQQAYVLHINEKYKNIFLSQLRSIFNIGLIFIAVLTFLGAFIGVQYEKAAHKTVSFSSSNREWTYQTEYWLVSSAMSETAEWVVRVTATNNLERPMSVQRLLVRDREGSPLPVEITYATTLPHVVAPRQTATIFATVKTNGSLMKVVASMDGEFR